MLKSITKEQLMASHIKDILRFIGDDPEREGLQDTPLRLINSWKELFGGYQQDPKDILKTTFTIENCDEMIVCNNIEFYSTCEHHFQPIVGRAHIGYIPSQKIVGLSKLPRLVECFARRLQVQEIMTDQILKSLLTYLAPLGAGVVLQAKHFCMCARGVNKQNAEMVTSAMAGVFKENVDIKNEFLKFV